MSPKVKKSLEDQLDSDRQRRKNFLARFFDKIKKLLEDPKDSDNPNIKNFKARTIDNARFGGLPMRVAFTAGQVITHGDGPADSDVDLDSPAGSLVLNGSGILIGLLLHVLFRRRYTRKQSINPLYRNFKTLASFGASAGNLVSNLLDFLPGPINKGIGLIIADLTSFFVGLVAIPYWFIQRKIHKSIPHSERDSLARIGTEGWSKYAKTALVFGAALGQIAGAIFGICEKISLTLPLLIGGGIGGVAAFIGSLIVVPLINKIFNKKLIFGSDKKDKFRNSYVRTGITLGLGIGSIIGFIIGTLAFPGIGSVAGLAIGGAVGSIIGGVTIGITGKRISRAMHGSKDSENSWDYATRSASFMGGFLGAFIGFFLPLPGGALLGAAAGSVMGWGLGLCVIKLARKICRIEKKAVTLPWTQRVATGSAIGCLVGAAVGFALGWFGGPAGAVAGFTLGTALGGFVGGLAGALYDKVAREMIARAVKRKRIKKQRMKNTFIYDGLQNRMECTNDKEMVEIEMEEMQEIQELQNPDPDPDLNQTRNRSYSLIRRHSILFPAPPETVIEEEDEELEFISYVAPSAAARRD